MNNKVDRSVFEELVDHAESEKSAQWNHLRSLIGIKQYERLYQTFIQYVSSNKKVLDWGAGNGHFSFFLCRSGYDVTSYGFEGYNLDSWLATPSYKFVKGNPREPVTLPFSDKVFTAAASVGVLEHVHELGGNEEGSLKEIYRVLKPGGLFICYHLPNKYSWIEFLSRNIKGKFSHDYRYTKEDIKRLVDSTGFEVIKIQRYAFLPRNSISLLPRFIRRSELFANLWENLDKFLGFIFSPFVQNYLFIARKPQD